MSALFVSVRVVAAAVRLARRNVDVLMDRSPDEATRTWRVEQILVDAEERNDWSARFLVDLTASDEAGKPVLMWLGIAEI